VRKVISTFAIPVLAENTVGGKRCERRMWGPALLAIMWRDSTFYTQLGHVIPIIYVGVSLRICVIRSESMDDGYLAFADTLIHMHTRSNAPMTPA
jgi:hypothetical protein